MVGLLELRDGMILGMVSFWNMCLSEDAVYIGADRPQFFLVFFKILIGFILR